MNSHPRAIAQRLFLRASAIAARLDGVLNRVHHPALRALSRFLGDEVAFADGRLVCRSDVPF